MADESPAVAQEAKTISFTEFLETCPPDTQMHVDSLADRGQNSIVVIEDDIHLPCDNEKCHGKGELHFAHSSGSSYLDRGKWRFTFATYTCRNCQEISKTFALAVILDGVGFSGTVLKLGETPAFGPQVPARVITLIGPDREIFLSGRRAENRGLGIGAFAYYRRLVENQKGRIIQEMAKVAGKLGGVGDRPEII